MADRLMGKASEHTKQVILPELGEGIPHAVVAGWNVRVGTAVKRDDDIVDLVTDKASFSVPAGCDGVVQDILVKEGATVAIGAVLAIIKVK